MKEEYLHAIWRMKRFAMSQLNLCSSEKVEILNSGWQNHDAGPDFFNASVKINEIIWSGNVEMHLKSSDWYKHKHQFDPAYNSVVLHVVHEHDQDVFVNGEIIPTLELKNYIDKAHLQNYDNLKSNQNWIACENQIHLVNNIVITNQIEASLSERLHRKSVEVERLFHNLKGNKLQMMYEMFAQAFGIKVNKLPFLELCKNLDLKILWKEEKSFHLTLVLGVAGFFKEAERFNLQAKIKDWEFLKSKHDLREMNFHTWKFKGIRPHSFPDKQLAKFTQLVGIQEFFHLENLSITEIQALISKMKLSDFQKNNLVINALVPILWWNFRIKEDENYKNSAISLLENLNAERNSIVDKWKELGVKCKSSAESQGLLELKNELCVNKKCLDCKIGYNILNK